MENRFHVCATCIHFRGEKKEKKMYYFCQRLGYETRPNYKFDCWKPKDQVKKLMEKRGSGA